MNCRLKYFVVFNILGNLKGAKLPNIKKFHHSPLSRHRRKSSNFIVCQSESFQPFSRIENVKASNVSEHQKVLFSIANFSNLY